MQSLYGLKKNLVGSVAEKRQLIEHDHAALSISRQCALIGISRASAYTTPTPPRAEDLTLYSALDALYTDHPYYGQRRMQHELSRQYDITAGRKRIRSAFHVLGLETVYQKPRTSIAYPSHHIYPYLLRNVVPTYPNHIWSTDITYIRIAKGFCYLVALIDWYSRKVIAWRLSPTLEIGFCLENLEYGLACAIPTIHNSDQGSHFTSPQYTDILKDKEVSISMDGRGRCLDNIFIERLWRAVKYEDVYLKGYATIDEVHTGLTEYFHFYNEERPHQSLNYQTPASVYANKTH